MLANSLAAVGRPSLAATEFETWRVVDKISGAGGEAIFLHEDVSLEESWPGVIEATERRVGRRYRHLV